jgi:SAM-dependent methyltransferase
MLVVADSNQAQADAWDGDEGAYWAENAEHFDRSVSAYHEPLLDAARIETTDRVLDIGCGTGQTTRDAARRASAGMALGVDLSSRMLTVARDIAREERVENAELLYADAQCHRFEPASYDAAISRTGAMFFGDPAAAFRNIGHALRPDARLALLAWQPPAENEWIGAFSAALSEGGPVPVPPADAPGPFALADPDRVQSILTGAGFVDIAIEGRHAGMWFGDDADDAHRLILGLLGWMLRGADEDSRQRRIARLHATMAAHETADGVIFGSAAWLITARRASA